MNSTLPDLWPHQANAIRLVADAINAGHRRICLMQHTGAGKSRTACELIRDWLHVGYKVSLYTNRKMLLDQLASTLSNFGLTHGRRSADAIAHGELPTDDPLQISSIQTEASRTLKKKVWQLHQADRIVVDEAHLNAGATAHEILTRHLQMDGNAVYLGLTATPLDIGHCYDHLIVASTLPELRRCGALVAAAHIGCEEPDTSKIKKSTVEMTEQDVRKAFNVQHIVGHVLRHFQELNPEHKPTILFAPGVPESIWFCEQFRAAGIEAAHIDGKTCIYRGERYDSDRDVRDTIMADWRDGKIKVVCNRFVLREGIDAPWIEHMVLATILSSLQSYLQSVGRGMRASPSTGKTRLVIQDHGGHWWRHGSVNVDREWSLEFTERMVAGMREERLRNKTEKMPARCPKCGQVTLVGRCHGCGFQFDKGVRPVIQEDGALREHTGSFLKHRYTARKPDTSDLWTKMYHRSKNTDRTFKAAMGLFAHEQGYWPPQTLHLMPTNERDMMRRVKDVPRERLT